MITRKIVRRTRGNDHGQITRLVSPGDLGELLKPFVFLDHFELQGAAGGMGLHPHSGIATLTYLFEGSIRYEDSNGATGAVPAGGVEWFKAAHGAWHGGGPGDTGRARGFQLWLEYGGKADVPATVVDLGKKVKAKFPGPYDKLSDAEVGRLVKLKYPGSYDDFVEVANVAEVWQFTVHHRVNKLKLTGLVAASLVIPAFVIRGLISILVWVIRGFKNP